MELILGKAEKKKKKKVIMEGRERERRPFLGLEIGLECYNNG